MLHEYGVGLKDIPVSYRFRHNRVNLRDSKGQTSRGISEDGCGVTDCQRKEAND
jgi:hypothetical protein